MAASAVEAFGAYLRQLRERRDLSLDDVASLSSSFPDPIGKAYLSRCENGKLKIAFSKTIALSRIYEVPPEVLAERMRLDLEIDRLGAPDTTGMSFREMYKASVKASHEGRHWDAYAIARDLGSLRNDVVVIDRVETAEQQQMACRLRVASVGLSLDACEFSEFELNAIPRDGLSPYYAAVLYDRLSVHERRAKRHRSAIELADKSIGIARTASFDKLLGPFFENRAMTYSAMGDSESAISSQQLAIEHYDASTPAVDRIQAYARLGTIYIGAKRLKAAKKILNSALKSAVNERLRRSQAQCLCLRGDVEWEMNNHERARSDWQSAANLLRGTNELRLKFVASTRLYRAAVEASDDVAVRNLRRRLARWRAAIPAGLPELDEYHELESDQSVLH